MYFYWDGRIQVCGLISLLFVILHCNLSMCVCMWVRHSMPLFYHLSYQYVWHSKKKKEKKKKAFASARSSLIMPTSFWNSNVMKQMGLGAHVCFTVCSSLHRSLNLLVCSFISLSHCVSSPASLFSPTLLLQAYQQETENKMKGKKKEKEEEKAKMWHLKDYLLYFNVEEVDVFHQSSH